MLRLTTMFASVLIAALGCGCGDDELSDPDRTPEAPGRFGARLDGSNVVPPVASNASGTAFLALETTSDRASENPDLFYSFQISGVHAATYVMLRRGQAGQNGEILCTFCGLLEFRACPAGERIEMAGLLEGAQFRGSAAEMDRLRKTIENGEAYIEVASKEFPGGELRGQLLRVEPRRTR